MTIPYFHYLSATQDQFSLLLNRWSKLYFTEIIKVIRHESFNFLPSYLKIYLYLYPLYCFPSRPQKKQYSFFCPKWILLCICALGAVSSILSSSHVVNTWWRSSFGWFTSNSESGKESIISPPILSTMFPPPTALTSSISHLSQWHYQKRGWFLSFLTSFFYHTCAHSN